MKIMKADFNIGDIIIGTADNSYPWANIKTVVTGVKNAPSYRSGIGIQTALRKGYYDSGYFTIIEPANQHLYEQLKSSEIF